MVKDSFVQSDDGTVTCTVKCPMIGCNDTCTVSFKGYRSYYKAKNKSSIDQSYSQPRWHLYPVEKHFRNRHIQPIPNPSSGDEHSSDTTSPDLIENQNEDSSNRDINENRGGDALPDAPVLLENNENTGRAENSTSSLVTNQTQQRVPKKRAYTDKCTEISVKRSRSRK